MAWRTRSATERAHDRWATRAGARESRLNQLNRIPLPSLYELHPEARSMVRRELGLRSIPLDEIRGTAVAGIAQRGSNFLPLPAFRSGNWQTRWQRLRRAVDSLVVLPPIDVLAYAGGYWVEDGHNRVAAALYAGQVEIDANVTELVPPGGHSSMPTGALAPMLETTRGMRAAAETGFATTDVAAAHDHDHHDEHDRDAER